MKKIAWNIYQRFDYATCHVAFTFIISLNRNIVRVKDRLCTENDKYTSNPSKYNTTGVKPAHQKRQIALFERNVTSLAKVDLIFQTISQTKSVSTIIHCQ